MASARGRSDYILLLPAALSLLEDWYMRMSSVSVGRGEGQKRKQRPLRFVPQWMSAVFCDKTSSECVLHAVLGLSSMPVSCLETVN